MAILQGFPGLKVEVWSGGGVLQEYDIEAEEADERNTVTKYIQATSNQKFQLHWLIHPTFKYAKNDISTHVYIDGEDVDNRIFSQAKLKKTVNYTNNGAERYEKGEWVLRKYKFSALETNDGDVRNLTAYEKERIQALGTISIKFWRIAFKKKVMPGIPAGYLNDLDAVPEKALKGRALSHRATFEEKIPTASREIWSIHTIDQKDAPFATFNFRYRSLAALKDLDIIPRTPSPEPLEARARNNAESLTQKEWLELNRRRIEEEERQRQIKIESLKHDVKRERSDSDNDDAPTVTEERPAKRPRVAYSAESGIELIELD